MANEYDDILAKAIGDLIVAISENTKLRDENIILKKKLFEEAVKHEQEKENQ